MTANSLLAALVVMVLKMKGTGALDSFQLTEEGNIISQQLPHLDELA